MLHTDFRNLVSRRRYWIIHGLKVWCAAQFLSARLNNVSRPAPSPPSIQRCRNMSPLCLSYQRLLQTIGVLEAQRTQAILDLEALARHQREALSNPIEFVEQLQRQVIIQKINFNRSIVLG